MWYRKYLNTPDGSRFLILLIAEGVGGAVRVEVVEGIRVAVEDCVVADDEVVANQCRVWCFHWRCLLYFVVKEE